MYYNKRDSKGRFTKTCRKNVCTCSKNKSCDGTYTTKLLSDCAAVCRNTPTDQLKLKFKNVVRDLAKLKVPEEDLADLLPFLTAMHTFYELSLKGSMFAQELDKRRAAEAAKKRPTQRPPKKQTDEKVFEDEAFKSVKDVAKMLGLPEDAIQDFVFMDLNTGECCEAHRKCKK